MRQCKGRVVMTAVLGAVVLLGSSSGAQGPLPNQSPAVSKPPVAPKEAAERIREYAQEIRKRQAAGLPVNTMPPSSPAVIKNREGIFYFVSWSIPEPLLKEYMREAFHLGATVVFRGLLENDMRMTVDRTKAIAVELGKEAPHTTIDPIIFRQLGVTTVPTLAVVNGQSALHVSGAAHMEVLLTLLGRADVTVQPIREWYNNQHRSWQLGGPVEEPRPAMPVLAGLRTVPSDLTRYPITEQDMEELLKERVRQVDWAKVQQDLKQRVKDRLHEGPNLPLTPAPASRVFTVDITQRYEHDIPNHDGSAVVVKAGTEINPLVHVTLRHRYLVIDGRVPEQVAYARSMMKQGSSIKVWLSAGDSDEVGKQLRCRVYWLQPDMVSRFQLAHVPSVISQNGPLLKIEEVAL